MKRQTTLLLLAAAVMVCGLFTGCQTAEKAAFHPTQYVTNQVPEQTVLVRTQQTVVVVVTNQAGEVNQQTNTVSAMVPVVIPTHSESKPVAWEANPQTVATVQGIGGLLGPYGSLGAAAITAALGIAAQIRSRKYRDAAVSLAQGVQHAVESYPALADGLKEIQKQVQDVDGTRNTVTEIIDKFVVEKPELPSATS